MIRDIERKKDKQTVRQKDTYVDGQIDRHTGRYKDKYIDGQKDRQKEI